MDQYRGGGGRTKRESAPGVLRKSRGIREGPPRPCVTSELISSRSIVIFPLAYIHSSISTLSFLQMPHCIVYPLQAVSCPHSSSVSANAAPPWTSARCAKCDANFAPAPAAARCGSIFAMAYIGRPAEQDRTREKTCWRGGGDN